MEKPDVFLPDLVEHYRSRIGKHVRAIRTDGRGWTLRDLSDRSGLSVSYLSDIERGRNSANMTLSTLVALAVALQVRISDLVNASEAG